MLKRVGCSMAWRTLSKERWKSHPLPRVRGMFSAARRARSSSVFCGVDGGIEVVVAVGVGGADDVGDAVGGGEAGHGDGGFHAGGAVVESGEEMVVDVYHGNGKGITGRRGFASELARLAYSQGYTGPSESSPSLQKSTFRYRILLVDDEPALRQTGKSHARSQGV